jgi:hypothetical protein
MSSFSLRFFVACLAVCSVVWRPLPIRAADLSPKDVRNSIKRAQQFLARSQNRDGSWSLGDGNLYRAGVSSLTVLALINSGLTTENRTVAKGLEYLRDVKDPGYTYERSLIISALAAAKAGVKDRAKILALARKLEDSQITRGNNAGLWSYGGRDNLINLGGDRSNGQFAVLGLRDAAHAGIPVSRRTWQRVRENWQRFQSPDGGWGYSGRGGSTGSMTVAGISTLVIAESMLRDGKQDTNPDGSPKCCGGEQPDTHLEKAVKWMTTHFAVGHNPSDNSWPLYYLYGLERAGRLSGRRFFGDHDWYREGAGHLVRTQSPRGLWQGEGSAESNPIVATSFALLFLSKGMAPVLINKLDYASPPSNAAADNWNLHRNDARYLTEHISGLAKWPKLLTSQVVELKKLTPQSGSTVLSQSKLLYLSGQDRPTVSLEQAKILREYVAQGGFIFAVNNCNGVGFEEGFRDLVERRMYPEGDAKLVRLPPGHPIYRSEYLLDPESVELYGVDLGCRTAIVFSPNDLSCLWDKWARYDPPGRPAGLKTQITRAMRIGVNVVAYATGREPPDKLEQQERLDKDEGDNPIERGFLQIAKIRHTGGWDAAPKALKNLLTALNSKVGLGASTKQKNLLASDPGILKYPLLYMHGRNGFELGKPGRDQLRKYLENGGVLFADACCGAWQFDDGFRTELAAVLPGKKLVAIPLDHELFSSKIGNDIRRVKRRTQDAGNPKATLTSTILEAPPVLEGITIDGRLAVIYSKYDISCALERQASVACAGYVPEDALKIAINIVLYAMLQDASYAELMK